MLRDLWNYIKQYPFRYFLVAVLAIGVSFAYVLPIKFTQLILDGMLDGSLTAEIFRQYMVQLILTIIFLYAGDALSVVILFNTSYEYEKNKRSELFKKLLKFRTPFYNRFNSGDILTRMTSDIGAVSNALSYGFLFIVGDVSWIIAFFIIMAVTLSWKATVLAVLPLIVMGVCIYYLGEQATIRYEKARNAVASLADKVLEMIDGVRVMRAYGKRHLEQERFEAETKHLADMSNKLIPINTGFGTIATFFTGLSMVIGLLASTHYLNQGQMTIGQVVSFQLYLQMISYSAWGISQLVAVYQAGVVSYKKLEELAESDDLIEREGVKTVEPLDSLEFSAYSFTYPGYDQATLSNVSFTLKKGETLGIVGRTGSGKTTLVKQLLRQYPLGEEGSIILNGERLSAYDNHEVENMLAYVPQEHILFSRSVEENIQLGQEKIAHDDLLKAVQYAALDQDLENMAAGLKTLIGEKGVAISGGQKQRVAIARALLRDAEILILDDSLSAVDAKTEQQIIKNIQELRAGKTTIIVTHRLSAIAHADQVLVLEEGKIVEQGSPAQLLENKAWFYEQSELQGRKEPKDDL